MEASVRCPRCGWTLVTINRNASVAAELAAEDYAEHLVKAHGLTRKAAHADAARTVKVGTRRAEDERD